MAHGDYYLIRFSETEAEIYTDREDALEVWAGLVTDYPASVRRIDADGTWSDETDDFGHIIAMRDPEGAACYRADITRKMERDMAAT